MSGVTSTQGRAAPDWEIGDGPLRAPDRGNRETAVRGAWGPDEPVSSVVVGCGVS